MSPFHAALEHHKAGRLAEAERLYRQILAADARHADARHLLGALAHQIGRHDAAVELIGQAIALDGAVATYHSNLGMALAALGRHAEAVAAYGRAIAIRPDFAAAHYNRGNALAAGERHDEAVAAYDHAIRLDPDFAEAHYNRGNALNALGRREDAVAAYDQAVRAGPGYAEAHSSRGNVLNEMGRQDEAVAAYDRAIVIRPDFAEAHCNRGNVLKDIGRHDEAVAAYDRAIRLRPDLATAHSNRLLCLHYRTRTDAATMLAAAREYGALFGRGPDPAFANSRNAGRRLRVGYVSPDFGRHPVGYFLAPVLAHHDRAAVEVFCYATHPRDDDLTARLRAGADHWRSLVGLGDEAATALIRGDAIDILIDLSGHTARNRLPLFALRPAPVQASWLGYFGTTGLPQMDYVIMDAVTVPEGVEYWFTERVVRLPGLRFCYQPPDYAPPVAEPPPQVTFGSFNNTAKLGAAVLDLWAAVLAAVPQSRLVLKWRTLADDGLRRRLRDAFAARGVDPARLELRPASPHPAMLAQYADIDIALDPFPFCGGLTSCEAMWMGVPVVTLPGEPAVSRQTLGFLGAVGLSELAAAGPADYVRIARDLAADRDRLAALRAGLRERMRKSPLCDGPAFAARLEAAYRGMWREWCAA